MRTAVDLDENIRVLVIDGRTAWTERDYGRARHFEQVLRLAREANDLAGRVATELARYGVIADAFIQALDDDHHGTVEYARIVVAGCALERSDAEIALAVDGIVRRNADVIERKRREQAAKGGIGIAARQSVPNLRTAPASVVTHSFGSGI